MNIETKVAAAFAFIVRCICSQAIKKIVRFVIEKLRAGRSGTRKETQSKTPETGKDTEITVKLPSGQEVFLRVSDNTDKEQ